MPPTHEVRTLAAAFQGQRSAAPQEITAAELALGFRLPEQYRDFVQLVDGAEGWAGEAYVSLWPVAQLAELNALARVAEFAPDLTVFGTDGGTEAFVFDRRGDAIKFASRPIVGLALDRESATAATFGRFLTTIAGGPIHDERYGAGLIPRWTRQPNSELLGKNVWQLHPVILGGHPTDASNRTILPLRDMLEAAAFWNRQLALITAGGASGV